MHTSQFSILYNNPAKEPSVYPTRNIFNKSLQYAGKVNRTIFKTCIDNLKPSDPYTKKSSLHTLHNYFTWSSSPNFLAQSIIKIPIVPNIPPSVQLPPTSTTHFDNHVYHHEIGMKLSVEKLLTDPDKELWKTSLSNEFGRLAQEIGKYRWSNSYVKGTNTIYLCSQIPSSYRCSRITYVSLIYDIKPVKSEKIQGSYDGWW